MQKVKRRERVAAARPFTIYQIMASSRSDRRLRRHLFVGKNKIEKVRLPRGSSFIEPFVLAPSSS